MKDLYTCDVRVSYDKVSGKIQGYYPINLKYDTIPAPFIIVNSTTYQRLVGNEKKYRIQNCKVCDISNSAEYLLEETKRLLSVASNKISTLATEASQWGVLEIGSHYINVGWQNFYETLLSSLKEDQEIKIKIYSIENSQYKLDYISMSYVEAQKFLTSAIESIKSYKTSYIPEAQSKFLEKLKKLQSSKNYSTVSKFVNSITYGYILNELHQEVPLKVS